MNQAKVLVKKYSPIFLTALCLLGLNLSLSAKRVQAQNLEIEFPQDKKSFSLADLKSKLKTQSLTLKDPVYKKEKTFDGFALADVLALMGPLPGNADEIAFQASDGYAPTTSLKNLKAHKGFIAFQEHGRKDQWELIDQGKAKISPAPFYLIWEDARAGEELPAPYQMVKIELIRFSDKYAKLYPTAANAQIMRGFVHFKEQCLRCHSINLVGGDLGPELNVPKNVTEYWSEKNLKAFVKNSSSFRAKSKMPAFESLGDPAIAEILNYLRFMKSKKII